MKIDHAGLTAIIWDLFLSGDLDVIDMRIIAARDCSPMPPMREVAASVGVSLGTVYNRIERIKALFAAQIAQ